ncbi:leucine-rich repeat domain-containing protein, partial [Paenibacillus glycinis]
MKKTAFHLSLALLVGWSSLAQVHPVRADAEGDFTYILTENAATVTGYTGSATDVIIPATLGGAPVTVIGRAAFDDKGLTSVVIPDTVTTLSTYAFRYDHLTSIDLPDSLTTLGASSLEGNRLTSVTFPDKVLTIGSYAFYMNSLASVFIPEGVTTIGGGAFDRNLLVNVVIPSSMSRILDGAFEENNLTSVTLLGSTTSIGGSSFASNPGNLKMFGNANSTAQQYAADHGFSFQDGTSLFAAMAEAKRQLADHPPGTEPAQVPANAHNALTNALAAARQFVYGMTAATSSSELSGAAAALNAAIQTFKEAIVPTDRTALDTAVAAARQALTDHPEGTDVGEASAGARSALQTAIGAAQAIADNAANLAQDTVDGAVTALNAALLTFQGAILPAGDASALNAVLANANQALSSHPEGTEVGQAPAAARSALQSAIAAAQAVADDSGNRTQSQLNAAQGALDAALAAFGAFVIAAGNAAALTDTLFAANQALASHPAGTSVGETPAAARDALGAAIGSAQVVVADASHRTQLQLDTAAGDLRAAIGTFEATIVPAGNSAALSATLGDAKQELADHPAGTNVGEASAAARSALQAAIDAAQAIADDAAQQTQSQLDAAVIALQAAVETFEDAIVVAGDGGNLVAALANAKQELTDHPAGDNVGESPTAARSALQSAIEAAQAIADDAMHQTQVQLDAAVTALQSAVETFEDAI